MKPRSFGVITCIDDNDDDAAAGTDGSGSSTVSSLPSTGQGSDTNASTSAIMLLFGAMGLVALSAAYAWRHGRTT